MTRLAHFILALVVAALPAAAAAQASTFRTFENEAFDTTIFNPCNGETTAITGRLLFESEITFDPAGGSHSTIHTHITGSGVGDQGNRYVFVDNTGVISTEVPASGVADQTISVTFQTIGTGATPDFDIHILIHSTVAPDGTILSSVLNIVFADRKSVV